jgi:aspartate/methionine/tyrosine aminotransferase
MQLKPFLLDIWLDEYEHDIEYNLGASTGPGWTLQEILQLGTEEERRRFQSQELAYSHAAGDEKLRTAIAEMQGVSSECVQVVTGASEALIILMWLAAESGANVILPHPCFATFSALPESLGVQIRSYQLRREDRFRIDVDEIEKLTDANTKLILVNSPHNPTGATISDGEFERLHAFAAERGIQLVSDEVYHPVYHNGESRSAARLPSATVISDFSKALSLAGLRLGWIIEHDRERRQRYWNARAYFTITNSPLMEALGTIAMRNRAVILKRTQEVASRNLLQLDEFMKEHEQVLQWIRPRGGLTAFPWLVSGENARPFCEALVRKGVLLAPGDCFDMVSHFRLGFGNTASEAFPQALERLNHAAKELLKRSEARIA